MNRSKLLPQQLDDAALEAFIRRNAAETFTDNSKRYFNEDEISEFEHESSASGREINRLKDAVKILSEMVTKGTITSEIQKDITIIFNKGKEEQSIIYIPATVGTKKLEEQRRQNDDLVERGFEVEEMEVFGLPAPGGTMEYFTVQGVHIPERSRSLSARENHRFNGMFALEMSPGLNVVRREDDGAKLIIDQSTGEVVNEQPDELKTAVGL